MAGALRTFLVGYGPFTGSVTKHSWSKIKVAVDWRDYLLLIESTIISSTWVAPSTATVVFSGAGLTDGVSSIDVSAGSKGEIVTVEHRVSFGDGTKDVFKLVVVIE